MAARAECSQVVDPKQSKRQTFGQEIADDEDLALRFEAIKKAKLEVLGTLAVLSMRAGWDRSYSGEPQTDCGCGYAQGESSLSRLTWEADP